MKKLVCGKNSVFEAIANGVAIEVLYVLKPITIPNPNITVKIITRTAMDALTSLNHQGFVAQLAQDFHYCNLDEFIRSSPPVILALDHIEDPQNLGAIIRSANAAGIRHIILPKARAAAVNATVWKVSSGGLANMRIARVGSLQASLHKLQQHQYWLYAAALTGAAQSYATLRYNFPLVLIIGNEAKGISPSLLKQSDQQVYIPLRGSVQSLNASVACGILLFEIAKHLD